MEWKNEKRVTIEGVGFFSLSFYLNVSFYANKSNKILKL